MTEKEIKEFVAEIRRKSDIFRKSGVATAGFATHFDKSADIIEELLPYMAIGTIEELKALKEKNVAKKVIYVSNKGVKTPHCPNCNMELTSGKYMIKFCNCEQKLNWQ